jgi:uncharacterized membrane protein
MDYESFIAALTRAVELVGVLALLLGAAIATGIFLRGAARSGIASSYQEFRANLGRAILLGLEILIIADIIGTIAVEPDLHNLSVLALIVLIRTFLSFALEIEITGRLPWRGSPDDSAPRPARE